MASAIVTYPLMYPSTEVHQIVSGPGGNLWFTEAIASGGIGSINPTTKAVTEYPLNITGSDPDGIVSGPGGKLWFADGGTGAIGVFNPSTHRAVEYPTPTTASGPAGLAAGPDGALWFTEAAAGKIGRIDTTTHAITEYPLTTSTASSRAIVLGPDNKLWFFEIGTDAIANIDPTTHAITRIPIPSDPLASMPVDPSGSIVVGPDRQIWFGAVEGIAPHVYESRLEAIVTTTHAFTLYSTNFVPKSLAVGPDGTLDFTSTPPGPLGGGDGVGEFDPTTRTESDPTPIAGAALSNLGGITVGPDGNLWFGTQGAIGVAFPVAPGQNIITGTVSVPDTYVSSPLAGRTVYVDLNGDGQFDLGDPSAVTDARGNYTIFAVPNGSYAIRVLTYPGDIAPGFTPALTGGLVVEGPSTLQPASALLPLSLNPAPFGTTNPDVTTAEVTALYNIVLGRAPDAPGLAFWVGAIKNGRPYAQVVSDFLHSTAYDDRVIASYYENFLGRAASPSEIQAWASFLQHGYTEEQVAYLMLTSAGFNSLHPDDGSFVRAMYGDFLGRQASPVEVAAWGSYLAGGASRSTVVLDFLRSQGTSQRAVAGLYPVFFAAQGDAAGEAFYVGALQHGYSLADVATTFFTSPAFVNEANSTVGR